MENEKRLSDVLNEFAGTLGSDFPIQAILDHLVEQIVEVPPIVAAGVTLILPGVPTHFVATSDEAALVYERLQCELGEGPRVAAYETGEAIVVPDLRHEARFPNFVPRALALGLAAVFSFPLRHGEVRLGALDLYREMAGPLDAASMAAAQTLADVAAAYVLIARARAELGESTCRSKRELETASRLAAIVEWSADAMIGTTLLGLITDWNSGAERMYGYTREKAVGRNVSMLASHQYPGELPLMLDRIGRGEGVAHYETQRLRKDGQVFEVSVSISPIRDQSGTVVGAATVTRDITERKRSEAEFRALQDQLHQAERLESVGQLAGGIAHDFNNLLACIMNYASLIADGIVDLTSRHGIEEDVAAITVTADIAEISTVAAQAAQLTRQLLIFSHRNIVQPEPLDLNSLVADMEKLVRQSIGEGIELVAKLDPGLPATKVDRSQIEQVLMNLAVNARDAMGTSGTLEVETATFEVEDGHDPRGLKPGQYVSLTVSDTGAGMAQEVISRAFEPYFTTKGRGEGSGLGLATVYRIARQAEGNVVISSEPGKGTSVHVNLPTTDEQVVEVDTGPPAEPPTSAGQTVLLVEDEDMVRLPSCRMLVRYGYRVIEASSADDALRVAADYEGDIDLLLTDVVMPGRSGLELAAEMGRLRPTTKVLFMSGHSRDLVGQYGAPDAGINLIEKPFEPAALRRRIGQILAPVQSH